MHVSRYHRVLRSALLIAAFLLVFDSGLVAPITKQLSDTTILYLANVGTGVFASVPQNELNSLSAQLSERERELAAREAALREREISARSFGDGGPDYSTYILSAILFIIIVLLTLNYILDFARVRNARHG